MEVMPSNTGPPAPPLADGAETDALEKAPAPPAQLERVSLLPPPPPAQAAASSGLDDFESLQISAAASTAADAAAAAAAAALPIPQRFAQLPAQHARNPLVETVLQVSNKDVGRIIGKGGSRIREIENLTGAAIQLSKGDVSSYKPTTVRSVSITGTARQVQHCRTVMQETLDSPQTKLSAPKSANKEPLPPNSKHQAAAAAEKRTLYIPSDMVATVVGSSSGVKLLEELSGARIKVLATGLHGATRTADRAVVLTGTELQVMECERMLIDKMNSAGLAGGGSDALSGNMTEWGHTEQSGTQTVVVKVPQEFIGRVIGKRGSYIRRMQQLSGATVTLPELPPHGTPLRDREMQISGSDEQIDSCVEMLRGIMAPPARDVSQTWAASGGGGYSMVAPALAQPVLPAHVVGGVLPQGDAYGYVQAFDPMMVQYHQPYMQYLQAGGPQYAAAGSAQYVQAGGPQYSAAGSAQYGYSVPYMGQQMMYQPAPEYGVEYGAQFAEHQQQQHEQANFLAAGVGWAGMTGGMVMPDSQMPLFGSSPPMFVTDQLQQQPLPPQLQLQSPQPLPRPQLPQQQPQHPPSQQPKQQQPDKLVFAVTKDEAELLLSKGELVAVQTESGARVEMTGEVAGDSGICRELVISGAPAHVQACHRLLEQRLGIPGPAGH